jgi:hypothetical protein
MTVAACNSVFESQTSFLLFEDIGNKIRETQR